ncbi:MAG: nicotinate-nucleotide adenylyltransferase [Planctomycetota bacterium]|jgi:nicotinate-nucleotide adenylyltransferase
MTRVGIFGGSFDPIHVAHLILAECARVERALDKVLFVPALSPPRKPAKPLAPAEERLRMVELAIADNPAFEASPLELHREGPSYTLVTVRKVREDMGRDAELFLILGADSVHDIPTWWHADELVREVEIIAVGRPGYALAEEVEGLADRFGQQWAEKTRALQVAAPLMDISATEVRERLRTGLSVRYLVPDPVREHIQDNGLYAARRG